MRRASNIDNSQPEAIRALRAIGATVQPLHTVGKGCPDLLVGYHGINVLVEMKDGEKCASHSVLNADQRDWHGRWSGQVCVARSAEEAVLAVVEAVKALGLFDGAAQKERAG